MKKLLLILTLCGCVNYAEKYGLDDNQVNQIKSAYDRRYGDKNCNNPLSFCPTLSEFFEKEISNIRFDNSQSRTVVKNIYNQRSLEIPAEAYSDSKNSRFYKKHLGTLEMLKQQHDQTVHLLNSQNIDSNAFSDTRKINDTAKELARIGIEFDGIVKSISEEIHIEEQAELKAAEKEQQRKIAENKAKAEKELAEKAEAERKYLEEHPEERKKLEEAKQKEQERKNAARREQEKILDKYHSEVDKCLNLIADSTPPSMRDSNPLIMSSAQMAKSDMWNQKFCGCYVSRILLCGGTETQALNYCNQNSHRIPYNQAEFIIVYGNTNLCWY